MSPMEKWESPHTKLQYNVNVMNQPILVCDILGFARARVQDAQQSAISLRANPSCPAFTCSMAFFIMAFA